MNPDAKEVLLKAEEISDRVKELGQIISEDYAKTDNLLVVGILKGSFVFMADLLREIRVPTRIDFMVLSSYGLEATSSGKVKIIKDLTSSIEGVNVLIVEDIIDTGNTLHYLLGELKKRNPASIKLCTLLDKPSRREANVKVDYCGFEIKDEFIVGYGLDYAEKYRNEKDILVLKPEIYNK